MMKLNMIMGAAFTATLMGCSLNEVPATKESSIENNTVDAVHKIATFQRAVEFTPKTNTSKQCVTVVGTSSGYSGGVFCWDKKPTP